MLNAAQCGSIKILFQFKHFDIEKKKHPLKSSHRIGIYGGNKN